jgi:hypothetical protein
MTIKTFPTVFLPVVDLIEAISTRFIVSTGRRLLGM